MELSLVEAISYQQSARTRYLNKTFWLIADRLSIDDRVIATDMNTDSPSSTDSESSTLSRGRFLQFAILVQGGVILLAFLIGYVIGVDPRPLVRWEPASLAWGLFAVGPMLVVYHWSPGLRTLAIDALGESLSRCRWIDLVVLAALAGVGEELLFRGVLYAGLSSIDPWVALIGSNVAFGLLHALSRNYFLTTTAIGFAMHALAETTGERNLLAPMVAHGVYDLVAFGLLIREWRRTHSEQGLDFTL